MKKTFLFTFAILAFAACQTAPTPTPEIPAQKVKKTMEKMTAAEVTKKFNIDVEPSLTFSGYYQVLVNAQNQETLDGNFEFESTQQMADLPENEVYNFQKEKYTGAYVNGQKDGIFKMEAEAWEAGGVATITFNKGQCIESTYKGGAEAICVEFKGKLPNCTFAAIFENTKEVECN